MARLPALLAALLSISLASGCGYVAVFGAINPGGQTVIGVVSIVQLQDMNDSSAVTVVTLVGGGNAHTLPFCGDQRSQFPLNRSVSAQYTAGPSCNTLLSVTLN